MDYKRRLLAAAKIVLSGDRRTAVAPPLDPSELGISAALKPHQIEGVSWLLSRYELGVNVILGDEVVFFHPSDSMGLGKTLQAISLLSYLKIHAICRGPFLILCPLSVTDGWVSEFTKFCPTLRVVRYVGEKGLRCDLRRMMCEHLQSRPSTSTELELSFDVLLTTYDIALLDQDFLSQIPWHYAVIDEAQRLKNPSSVLYNVLEQQFVMPRLLLLTGTPIQNNLSELWALLHFCMPAVFGTLEQFLFTFKEAGKSSTGHIVEKRQFETLKYILGAFMLRRTKALLIETGTLRLPQLTEITLMVPLVPLQRRVYMSILRRELPELLYFSTRSHSHQTLQNIVIQLRKACSHPYLFTGIEPEPYEEGEHLVQGDGQASGKLIVLDQLLTKLHPPGHRVLLFAQMTHTLDILQDFLELRKYTYERLDGSVRAEERFAAIRSFSLQQTRSTLKSQDQYGAFVFLISTRAGGVGLNLVAADTVIFYEQDWNPQVDKQALQRVHRIGQMNHVLSINLVTERTIEEVIMRRAERKLQLSKNVIGQTESERTGKNVGVENGDMRSLIFGLQIFDPMDINTGNMSENNMAELDMMTRKVIELRNNESSHKIDCKFEINPTNVVDTDDLVVKKVSDPTTYDLALDEASYLSWVEKFKEASQSVEDSSMELEKRKHVPEKKHPEHGADRKKAEEKMLAKWEALGYQSLTVKDPDSVTEKDVLSDSGSVHFVYGDCTDPLKVSPSKPAIIFSCVDTSGNWGRGGMFDALSKLSSDIPDAYHRAFECGDLHLGDLHLVKLNDASLQVALAVVQSYNPRRKVPRSDISLPDLERCLSKASFSAAQNSASIHMPRIGDRDGSQLSEWYTIERLLRKYASIYGIDIFVYYFRRHE